MLKTPEVMIRAPRPSCRHRVSRPHAGARRSGGAESLSERLARGVRPAGNARAERLLSRARLTHPRGRLPRPPARPWRYRGRHVNAPKQTMAAAGR